MNRVLLIGRIANNLELRYTQNRKAVVSFSLAVPKRDKDDGADFISCVAWGNTAEVMSKYLTKGNRIAVSGRLTVRTYTKDDKPRYVTEVVADEVEFLESKKADASNNSTKLHETKDDDDELPF